MKEKIVIITDAWIPQTNGVVTTLKNLVSFLEKNYDVLVVHPGMFKGFDLVLYKEIRISIPIGMSKILKDFDPDYFHIATEGPLGMAAKRYCNKYYKKFNTSFHTNFPYLIKEFLHVPEKLTWLFLRFFHKGSERILVTNEDVRNILSGEKFKSELVIWTRGIDSNKFYYEKRNKISKKINLLYVGRISKEKNLKKFCKLSKDSRYNCILIGDGPYRKKLEKKYPKVSFIGKVPNDKLYEWYQSVDVFFFPSLFDTFGIVMLEAIACGLPVVAYDITGPRTLIQKGINGYIIKNDNQIHKAIRKCLRLDRQKISESVKDYTWENVTYIFISNLSKA